MVDKFYLKHTPLPTYVVFVSITELDSLMDTSRGTGRNSSTVAACGVLEK